MIHHRIDDPMHEHSRSLAERAVIPLADAEHLGQGSGNAGVNGNQELLAEKEVDVLGLEAVFGLAEVDAVENQVQVVAVRLDLGMMNLGERILDGELVEVEHVAEDADFVGGRSAEIHPDPHAAARLEPGRINPVHAGRRPALVTIDRNHRERF